MPVCYNCFREKQNNGVCPLCGYDPAGNATKYPLALKQGAILNGRYVIGRVLGQGGFGITYIALDDRRKRRVAVKEYLPTDFAYRTEDRYGVRAYSGDRRDYFEYGKQQFLIEAKTLANFIGESNIVRVHRYFEENGTAYFSMEYVDGVSLHRYMWEKGGRLSVEETNSLLLPLMESLDQIHARGIVHRDIAPDNILVQRDGRTKLIDFGAARYSTGEKSQSLDVILKHGYAPYEQYMRHGRQGPFTDVYAMAATYYHAITGKIPPEAVDRMVDDAMLPPSALGAEIDYVTEAVLLKALAIRPGDRIQRMGQFREALLMAKDWRKQEPLWLRTCGVALADGYLTAAAWLDGRSEILYSMQVNYPDKRNFLTDHDQFGTALRKLQQCLQDRGYDWRGEFSLSVPDCSGNLEIQMIRKNAENAGFQIRRVIFESEAAALVINSEDEFSKTGENHCFLFSAVDGYTSLSWYDIGDGVIDSIGRFFPNGERREERTDRRAYHQQNFQKYRDELLRTLFSDNSKAYLVGDLQPASDLFTELKKQYVGSSSRVGPHMGQMMGDSFARGAAIMDAVLTGWLGDVLLVRLPPPYELYVTVNGSRYNLLKHTVSIPARSIITVNSAGSTVIVLYEKHGEKSSYALDSCVLSLNRKGESIMIDLDIDAHGIINLTVFGQSGNTIGKMRVG